MANRNFVEEQYTLLKGVVHLFARVSVGGTGAVTLQSWDPVAKAYATAPTNGFGGIKSVVRSAAGKWTVTLQDTYQRFLAAYCTQSNSGGASTAPFLMVDSAGDVTLASAPTIKLVFTAVAAGSATDPASGDKVDLHFILSNSSAL